MTTNDTITVSINTPASAITAKGETTGQTISPTPATIISTAQQTIKTPKLTITKNSSPTDKTVITNSQQVLLGSWQFDATNSGEDVRVTSVAVRASTTGKINTLTLKTDSKSLNPVNDNPVVSNSANTTSTFALTDPLVITKGTSVNLNLYGNVASNANTGEVDAWGLTDTNVTTNTSVVAYGVGTGNRANINLNSHNGALLTFASSGTLTIDLDSSAPAARKVVHGTTGIVLSEVRLKTTNESIDITRLIVRIEDGGLLGTNDGTYTQIAKVILKLDGSVVGNSAGYSLGAASTTINFERDQLTIPEGSTGKKLSILGDIVNIGTNQPGVANADIKVGLNGKNAFQAVGNGSNSSATKTYNGSTGTALVLHKAVPSVVLETPTNKLSGSPVLHRAKISAVGNTVGIYALSYVMNTTSGLSITNAYLKLVSCGSCGGVGDNTQLTTASNPSYFIDGFVTVQLNVNTLQGTHGKRYLAIPAGATAVIDLLATVTGVDTGDSVSTSLLGDTATTTNDLGGVPAAAFVNTDQGAFVWSDLNLDDTQNAATLTSKQWYNGYIVAGLGATATTTAETISY